MIKQGYLLDNAWAQARERLGLLETALNPGSIRHLETLGVDAGWRCLDVGAGSGSISEWLCRQVGARGHVLATDVDTRFLDELKYPNLEVLRHDITIEALPERVFDLVYARTVLTHLAGRDVALQRMAAALNPAASSSSRRQTSFPGRLTPDFAAQRSIRKCGTRHCESSARPAQISSTPDVCTGTSVTLVSSMSTRRGVF
jgi:2-polyprenyl-3-methyl-5-hydroxy-6-metoxy-1,4-benzoquinol methylase